MAFIKLQHVILSQIRFNKSQGRAYIRGGLGIFFPLCRKPSSKAPYRGFMYFKHIQGGGGLNLAKTMVSGLHKEL